MMAAMNTYDAIISKRDVRNFASRPIPEGVLRRILQAGRMAGSAKAAEPVRFVLIQDPAQRAAVAECGNFTPHLPGAAAIIALVLLPEFGEVGAPFSLFRGPFDAGRAAQNMMLAAWGEGIASCPATLHNADKAREVLGLPEGHYAINVIALGYPEGAASPGVSRPRQPIEEYVHRERW
jgi:nitroreductase